VAARGHTAQRVYRLIKATENVLKEIGCSNVDVFNQECVNTLKTFLEGLGCDSRYIWGTYIFVISNCEVPDGFQPLEPIDFHSLTGFSTDDISYVFYGGDSMSLTDLLEYGPVQFPLGGLKFNVFHFDKEKELWDRFLVALGAESINKNAGVVKLGGWATLSLHRESINNEMSLLRRLVGDRLVGDKTPAVLLTNRDLQLFEELKRESLRGDERGCFSRLQIVRGQTLQRFNEYTKVNLLSALVTKSGGVPYTLEISPINDIGEKFKNLLNSGVFIGITLGKTLHGDYEAAAASIITADLTVKLCYHKPLLLEGSSMEMVEEKIERFVDLVAGEIRQLVDRRSVGLIAIFRTRRFKQDEGEGLLNALEDRLFKGAKRLGKRPVILAVGVGKYLPLLAEENEDREGNGDLVWVVEEGKYHGILLYKFHGFKNAVRIEYRAGGALEEVEVGAGAEGGKRGNVAGLVLATYEYTRRLDVMGPYPIEQKVLPAPLQFARKSLRWSQVKWEWIR